LARILGDDPCVAIPRASNFPAPALSAGQGLLEVEKVNGRSAATRVMARSPLRILTPRNCPGNAAWVFTSTFGGGLVSGDHADLQARIGVGARCVLATQSSTKVFRSKTAEITRQTLSVSIAAAGVCAILPDPVTCYAGASFEQRMRIDLDASASLVLVDWLTSGRKARGERWALARYASRIEAAVGSKLAFRDAILLDRDPGPIDGLHRMGRYDCFGLMLMLGPAVAATAEGIVSWDAGQPIHRGQDVIFSISPLAGGAVIRVAGTETEAVGQWIRQRLGFLGALLGADPWSRKW
jgi:urease accessory protein